MRHRLASLRQLCLAALRAAPPIPGLTEHLFSDDNDAIWQRAIERLRTARLLADDDDHSGTLDAHPLVRECFEGRLVPHASTANGHNSHSAIPLLSFREAHSRLYEYLKNVPTMEQPDSLNEMMPLFHAIRHAHRAGDLSSAIRDVYWPRINRGERFFSSAGCGAVGAVVTTLSGLVQDQSINDSSTTHDPTRAFVMSEYGYHLAGIGQPRNAIQKLESSYQQLVNIQDWEQAGYVSCGLAALHVFLGNIEKGTTLARSFCHSADNTDSVFWRTVSRVALGNALNQAGQSKQSRKCFREAISIAKPQLRTWNTSYYAASMNYVTDYCPR